MKRNKTLRIATILLALVLVSTLAMVGTLARYVTTVEDLETGRVRAGLFRVVAGDDEIPIAMATNLFDGDFTAEEHVAQYTESTLDIIVPGTIVEATAVVSVANYSEVDVRLEVAGIDIGDAADGWESVLLFSTGPAEGTDGSEPADWNWQEDVADLDASEFDFDEVTIPALAGSAASEEFEFTIFILWPFISQDEAEDCDYQDGELGLDGVSSANDDEADTEIGEAQADFFLDDDDNSFTDAEGSLHELNFEVIVRAVQID
jgi:hypothetical protein